MSHISRREFIRKLAALGLGLAGAGALGSSASCGPQPVSPTARQSPGPAEVGQASPSAAPTAATGGSTAVPVAQPTEVPPAGASVSAPVPSPTARSSPTPAAGSAYLAVARGESPTAMVRAALEALGGIGRFVKPGYNVIIKPNICTAYYTYEYATTTNPEVVAALVSLCLGAGAGRVRVMDYPFGGTPEQCYAKSGIADAVKAAGGQMEVMSMMKFQNTPIPRGKSITQWKVYRDALEADVLINVPIAKTHNLTTLTLGMKNLMGLVQDRETLHNGIDQRLADLASLIVPTLTVVDAVRILVAGGPTGGNLNNVRLAKTIIASHDIVSADTCAATLFNVPADRVAGIRAGANMGLGTMDLKSVKVEEIAV